MFPSLEELKLFGIKYCLAVSAAGVAETVTYPLDLTKARLQIQGEALSVNGNGAPHRGMVGTAFGVVREEGFLKLWQGVSPALVRHTIYTSRTIFYEVIRENYMSTEPTLWQKTLAGATVGALAQCMASPTDLVKIQMQMEGRRRLQGLPPRVHSMWQALTTIVQSGGIRALWRGSIPNMQRAALVNCGDLATYDTSKRLLMSRLNLKDTVSTHALSSCCSGLVAATLSTPADVVKTRIMNQPLTSAGKGTIYTGALDCLLKTVRNEGFFALYKGFVPIWSRMAPFSLTFWMTYEQVRHLAGVRSF